MGHWEPAVEKFLEQWRHRDEVIGAVVCGSYITGNPGSHSDIDIHIILDDSVSWRERGNVRINGLLVEYFANPVTKHADYAEEDYRQRKRINAHMFSTGSVLFDKTGAVRRLVEASRDRMHTPFPPMHEVQIEQAKYRLWDLRDNLEESCEAHGLDFPCVYFLSLYDLFDTYAQFLRLESVPARVLHKYLLHEDGEALYLIPVFPDREFAHMVLQAIACSEYKPMMTAYSRMTDHVLERMGGFCIDKWKLTTPAW